MRNAFHHGAPAEPVLVGHRVTYTTITGFRLTGVVTEAIGAPLYGVGSNGGEVLVRLTGVPHVRTGYKRGDVVRFTTLRLRRKVAR